jgi:hypothetical protein
MLGLVEQAEARVLCTVRAEMEEKFNEMEDRLGGKLANSSWACLGLKGKASRAHPDMVANLTGS